MLLLKIAVYDPRHLSSYFDFTKMAYMYELCLQLKLEKYFTINKV